MIHLTDRREHRECTQYAGVDDGLRVRDEKQRCAKHKHKVVVESARHSTGSGIGGPTRGEGGEGAEDLAMVGIGLKSLRMGCLSDDETEFQAHSHEAGYIVYLELTHGVAPLLLYSLDAGAQDFGYFAR